MTSLKREYLLERHEDNSAQYYKNRLESVLSQMFDLVIVRSLAGTDTMQVPSFFMNVDTTELVHTWNKINYFNSSGMIYLTKITSLNKILWHCTNLIE